MSEAGLERPSILIIDDDEQIRGLLEELLGEAHDCTAAKSAEAAISVLKAIKFDLVISDINMGAISGLDLVPYVLRETPETVVVMMSGQQKIDSAIQAMRAGAFDYITKPLDIHHAEAAVQRALAHHKLLDDKKYYENNLRALVRQRTREIERLAHFDTLTDLPNRLLFEDRLSQALNYTQREGQILGTLLIRVDRFNKLNDTLGHALSDRLLCDIAERIKGAIGERGTVARFEGDEFAILLADITGSEKVIEALRDVSEALKLPFGVHEHELFITMSIGARLFPVDGKSVQELLEHAAVALDRARMQGGNNYQFYEAQMNALALERLTMEASLRRAVKNNEFKLYYQPQFDLTTQQMVGVEALIRWQHPKLGLLLPAKFIPMAEETGLILPIGEWVLRAALAQAALWHNRGLGNLRIAVNVSPRQFQQENFVELVLRIVAETVIDPSTIELEITETSIMQNAKHVVALMSELKQMGLKIAIDDFGIGYSSLAYLKRLPIDMLKIDRTFISDAASDPDDAALVVAIITLAHNLRLQVLAEGVETVEQLRFLQLLKCDEGQGYFLGRPAPPESFSLVAWKGPRNQAA
ncbi:MAG: putative bifunctional diguanylate cyclase/phosphodiesterase [Pyrinomonadaceae bacterium]